MNSTTVLVIGGIAVAAAILMRCKVEFLQPLCDAWPEGESLGLDEIIKEFNSKPTLLQNPKTSDYRSTTMTKEPLAKTVARFETQRKAGQKAADNVHVELARQKTLTPAQRDAEMCAGAFCKTYPKQCAKCSAKSSFAIAQSLFTTTRLAI